MKSAPRIGTTGETIFVVEEKHCIEFATARGIEHSGRFVDYQIEARDGQELIAWGVHKRAVVRTGSFSQRVRSKTF